MTEPSPGRIDQRRGHLAASDDWIRRQLSAGTVMQLAVCLEGAPYMVPTTFWFDGRRAVVFHASPHGRLAEALGQEPHATASVFELGRRLPSNAALEFSVQYRSVMLQGVVKAIAGLAQRKEALTGLVEKYFPRMRPGHEYRPITDREAERTAVYRLEIESWSGKENWPDSADQTDEWPSLPAEWLAGWDG